jgi:phospholipid/cholesterol/gamma-HCH transport system ATP-binding protein
MCPMKGRCSTKAVRSTTWKGREDGIRQEIGMLFQGSALFDSLTVMQNVMFPLQMFVHHEQERDGGPRALCLKRVNIGQGQAVPS